MSAVDVIAHESLPKDATFHLDAGIEDPEEFLVVHELLGRGQLLNAYEAKMTHQVRVSTRFDPCLLYTSPSPRDLSTSRMPSSA